MTHPKVGGAGRSGARMILPGETEAALGARDNELLRVINRLFLTTLETLILMGPLKSADGPIIKATGVLYRAEGGLVGHAAGSFDVFSGGRVLNVNYRGTDYSNPYEKSGFASPDSGEIGAIWTIWYHTVKGK